MSSSESAPRFFTATGVSFTVALLLSISVAAYSYYSVRAFQEAETWINTTQSEMQKREETLATAKDLIGAARGYALTGQSEYLARYRRASKALPQMMADIRPRLHDNPDQAQRENSLWNLLVRRIEVAQEQIKQAKPDPTDIFDEGRDLTNQIRTKFNEIKDAEDRLVEQRSQDSQRRAMRTKYAIIGGNLLSCLIMIWVFARLRREMRKRHIAQELAQKNARECEDLYNLAPCGYHSIDRNGTIIKMNDTGLQWFGYTREEMIGKKAYDLMTPESARRFTEIVLPKFVRDGAISAELSYVRRDGSIFIASMNAVAMRGPDNEFLMSRTVLNDVTALKTNESKIENLNHALRTRAAQLELANKELEGFSYSVSHDLRAPLRVIGGYAMMLEEDYTDKLDEDGKRYLNVIRANTSKMDALIVDLLKLAKSTLAPMTLAVIDMRQMVQKASAEIALENNAAITIGRLDDAIANAALLVQVWENLLANAVKFSRAQPRPAIDIRSERNAGEIIYCVEDNGVGLDVAQAPKLFEVFQRFHSQEEFPGAGVGLALVKRIVLRHGGRVWAESRPGAGARFYFSLPGERSDIAAPRQGNDPSQR